MNRQKFLFYLRRKLWRFPKSEVDEAVAYYNELIGDKMAGEGMTEEGAVASLGDKKKIVEDCIAGMQDRAPKEKQGMSTTSAVAIGMIASPLLFPLSIVAFVLIVVAVAVWGALVVSFGAIAIGGVVVTFGNWFFYGDMASALICTGVGLAMASLGSVVCGALAIYGAKGLRSAFRGVLNGLKRRG